MAYYPQFGYTSYLWPYYQQQPITPFIPPTVPLPPSPNAGAGTRRVHFEDEADYRPRPRAPSFSSGMVGTAPPPNPAPFPSPPFLYTPLPSVVPLGAVQPQGYAQAPPDYTHRRRRSDSILPAPAFAVPTWIIYPTQAPAPTPNPPAQLNPLLNAEYPHNCTLLFDLSLNVCDPQRVIQQGPKYGPLSRDELAQLACWPGVTRMVITCDDVPEWKVVLEPYNERPSNNGYLTVPSDDTLKPITVNDVLFAIHKMFQRQIRHRDWVELPQSKATAVARAYTRRCRTFATTQAFEESQGVRRVDFLEDRYMFKGLVRQRGEQGFENLRLLVGKR